MRHKRGGTGFEDYRTVQLMTVNTQTVLLWVCVCLWSSLSSESPSENIDPVLVFLKLENPMYEQIPYPILALVLYTILQDVACLVESTNVYHILQAS